MLTSAKAGAYLKEPREGDLYLAGERAPKGIYRQVDTNREIVLDREDILPGSLDGRVACYEPAPRRWKNR